MIWRWVSFPFNAMIPWSWKSRLSYAMMKMLCYGVNQTAMKLFLSFVIRHENISLLATYISTWLDSTQLKLISIVISHTSWIRSETIISYKRISIREVMDRVGVSWSFLLVSFNHSQSWLLCSIYLTSLTVKCDVRDCSCSHLPTHLHTHSVFHHSFILLVHQKTRGGTHGLIIRFSLSKTHTYTHKYSLTSNFFTKSPSHILERSVWERSFSTCSL